MKYTTNIVSTWFVNKVCMLSHSTTVLSGLHHSTSTGSSDAGGDTRMHEEHKALWQCKAAAAGPGDGSMFAKAVAVWCIMYRAAVVLFDLVLRSACSLKKSLGMFLFMQGDSLQGFVWENYKMNFKKEKVRLECIIAL